MTLDIRADDTVEEARAKLAAYQLDVINRIYAGPVTPIDPRRRNHPAYGPGRSLEPRHTVRYYQIRHSVRLALAGAVVTGVVALAATAVMLAAWAYGLLF